MLMKCRKLKLLLPLLLGALIYTEAHAEDEAKNNDPLEGLNRKIFAFNEILDDYFLKPIAKGYRFVAPDILEEGISNFYSNLTEVSNVTNNLLQAKFLDAGSDTLRFLVNTTVGLVGFIDVGSRIGLDKHDEDFGQTLGVWGVSSGPYLMVPFLGPKTLRSATGTFVDTYASAYQVIEHERTRHEIYTGSIVDTRARLLDAEKLIMGDKYVFIREAYLQREAYLTLDGVTPDGDLDSDISDDFFDDDELEEDSSDESEGDEFE